MKTPKDPRHLQRIRNMQHLFASEFSKQNLEEQSEMAEQILENKETIDDLIKSAAPAWPIEKINKIDLAILRQAIFELTIEKKVPPKVIVDEAVEIAKEYGGESSPSFINGVLGKLIEDLDITT